MQKYRVMIIPPKAKRMKDSGKLIVGIQDPWNGHNEEVIEVGDKTQIEFDIPDGIPWRYNTSVMDGREFDVRLTYSNATGTRQEFYRPVPELIN